MVHADLDKYERSIKSYDDSSDEFKPFREVSDSMPYPHGQCAPRSTYITV